MHIQILEHPDLHKYDLSTLLGFSSGGAPAPVSFAKQVKEKFATKQGGNGWGWFFNFRWRGETTARADFGLPFSFPGMSETLTGVIGIGGEDYLRKPNSIGIPLPNLEVKYVDVDTGKEVPVGQPGELLIKGPQVLKEYFNKPEANAKSITKDGWFYTGDIGKVDEEGFQ